MQERKLNPQTKHSINLTYQERMESNQALTKALKQLKSSSQQGLKQLQALAEKGDDQAAYELYRYYKKQGKPAPSQVWLERAAESFNPLALQAKAQAATKQGLLTEAAQYNLSLAIKDDLLAMYITGRNYIYGTGLPQQEQEGINWLLKLSMIDLERYQCLPQERALASKAVAQATQLLCDIYKGEELEGKFANSLSYKRYLTQAAEQGSIEHQLKLALTYYQSTNLYSGPEAALWLERILKSKNAKHPIYGKAAYYYALHLAYNHHIQDYGAQIKKYAQLAINHGYKQGYYPLGLYYLHQLQYQQADKCYSKVLELDTTGEYHLALGALHYNNPKPDTKQHLLFAAEKNHPFAYSLLSILTYTQDQKQAQGYERQACRLDKRFCERNQLNKDALEHSKHLYHILTP